MATVKFYLNRPKKGGKLREDEVSIVAKFTVSRNQRFELPVNEKICPKFWDVKSQEVKTKFKYHIDFNQRLDDYKNELLNIYRKFDGSFEDFKLIAISWAKGDTNEKKSLWDALTKFIIQYSNSKDTKTVLKFITLETELKKFNSNLTFSQLNNEFYDDFKNHLVGRQVEYDGKTKKLKWPNHNYPFCRLVNKGDYWGIEEEFGFRIGKDTPVPLFDSTLYRYFKDLCNFLKWAATRNYPVNPVFKTWEIIIREYDDVITFNEEELNKLLNHRFQPRTQIAIDYLLIECFCGQRVSDITRFDIKDLQDDTWTFTRYKGRRLRANAGKVTIRFVGYIRTAYLLLEKYDFRMPSMDEHEINKLVKEGCKEVGINQYTYQDRWSGNKLIRIDGLKHEFISTHTGRRTFITLALTHGIPAKVVMDLVGISSHQTLKKYEGKSSGKATSDYMEKLGNLIPMQIALKKAN